MLSVVIPVYNGAKWIDTQLDALARQDAPFEWEVVVADNGSTDDTRSRVVARTARFPVRLRVVDASSRRGVAYARNVGVQAAHADRFAICDCDDTVVPRWVTTAASGLHDFDFVTGPQRIMNSTSDATLEYPARTSFGVLLRGGNFGGRREAYLTLGGMDETLPGYGSEDAEFSLRVYESGARVGVLDEMIIDFRPTPRSTRLIRKLYESAIAEVAVWRRHPVRYASQLGFGRALIRAAAFPAYMLHARSMRAVGREGLRRIAHIQAQLPWAAGIKPPSARSASESQLALWVVPMSDMGGVARHILDATRIGIPGWRVAVLCPEGPLADRLRAQGSTVITGAFGALAGVHASRSTLARVTRALRPSIVHSHLAYGDIINAWTCLPKGTHRFTTEHGIAGDDGVYHHSPLRSKVMAYVHRIRFSRFDGVIAVSGATRDAMIAKWRVSQPITVIPNGVDLPAGVQRRRPESVPSMRILSLSRLAAEKNIDLLLRAFALVRATSAEATLTVAGEGPLRRDLENLANSLGISDAVSFLGFVDADTAMADADVIVQLSVWENCSYSLLDATARGMRVVASAVGGNPEILPASALVASTDPAAVAEILSAPAVEGAAPPPQSAAQMCERIAEAYGAVSGPMAWATAR